VNPPKLAGAKDVAGVRKRGHQLDGAGLRVNLTVGKDDLALVRISCAVGQIQLQIQILAAFLPTGFLGTCGPPAKRMYSCSLMAK
jgi:hypothetical protein